MGATNTTTVLDLPLFVDGDKPTWRGDFNDAMNQIENGHVGLDERVTDTETGLLDRYTKSESDATFAPKTTIAYAHKFVGATVTDKLDEAIATFDGSYGTVIIDGSLGAGEPTNPYPPNVTIVDLRPRTLPGAGIRFGTSTVPVGGGVNTRMSITESVTDANGVSMEVAQFQCFSRGTPTGLVTNEALTAVSNSQGAFGAADSRFAMVGIEAHTAIQSQGGTIPNVRGIMANIASDAGATTRVGWGAALVANPPTNGAANIFYNAYGAYLQQPTGATARNYALYVAGGSLYNNSQIINALLPSVTATDATMAAGSNILTSASSNFLTTVAVGAVITVTGAGPNGGTLKSIVTGITDDTHLTLLDKAVGTVAASTYIADGKPVGILFLGSGAADNTVLFRPLDDAKGIQIKSQIGTVWATFSSAGVKFNSTVSMDDSAAARLIEVGTVNGSRIGTAASKIGFYGAAPVARPFGVPNAATDLPTVIALANDLRAKMLTLGLTT